MKVLISVLAGVLLTTTLVYAQQINSWTIGNFTLNVPATNPVVTVQSPNRSGTLALKEDIIAGPAAPVAREQRGEVPLVGGTATVVLTGFSVKPFCVVSDPSGNSVRFIVTTTSLTLSGVGPSVVFDCK